jgi:hypothetical protein
MGRKKRIIGQALLFRHRRESPYFLSRCSSVEMHACWAIVASTAFLHACPSPSNTWVLKANLRSCKHAWADPRSIASCYRCSAIICMHCVTGLHMGARPCAHENAIQTLNVFCTCTGDANLGTVLWWTNQWKLKKKTTMQSVLPCHNIFLKCLKQ